ncbi:MAG: cupin domain-containing protein [Dermatophilus congolensis]|nr:cupin domain-containing protein [Dermatophilus congolensis]
MTQEWFGQPGGILMRFLTTGADTGGAYFEFESVISPGAPGPPPHLHRVESEAFSVTEGVLSVRHGAEWHELGRGTSHTVPPNVVHAFANRGTSDVRVVTRETPAGQLQEQLLVFAEAGRIPPLLQLAAVNSRHDFTFRSPAYRPLCRRSCGAGWPASPTS